MKDKVAASPNERQKKRYDRLKAEGCTRLAVWIPDTPEHKKKLHEFVAALNLL